MAITPCPPSYSNPNAKTWSCDAPRTDLRIIQFHKSLPFYAATPLISLPTLARSLGLKSLFVKDESSRFGLPSYKILGASWAIYRAICSKLKVVEDIKLEELGKLAQENRISLVACSDGNWGRAVARMARYLGIPATILVPENIDEATQRRISSEGATCRATPGDYDDSILAARRLADESQGALLVMDTSWDGYTQFPQWVSDGYSTMLEEVAALVPSPSVVFVSVGVGSWAHAAVLHYKRRKELQDERTRVVTVEPTVAASLLTSLHAGKVTPILTGDTIMCGMNCGTTSDIAWPYLRDGVDAGVTVSDREAHEAVRELQQQNDAMEIGPRAARDREGEPESESESESRTKLNPGPCGAATLVALRKVMEQKLLGGSLEDAEVVLFNTEGEREYEIPTT